MHLLDGVVAKVVKNVDNECSLIFKQDKDSKHYLMFCPNKLLHEMIEVDWDVLLPVNVCIYL